MKYYTVYVTTKDADQAMEIGRALVAGKLAACINVVPGVQSIYWWQGEVHEGQEAALLAKTTQTNLDTMMMQIKALHSYDCPCIVAWPIGKGDKEYLSWIDASVR